MKTYYQNGELIDRIDWEQIMPMKRYSGGHDDQMKGLLKNCLLVAHVSYGDYEGEVATCVILPDTEEIIIYRDYYGSCSGCDAWDGANDKDVRIMCKQLACGALVFKKFTDLISFLEAKGDKDNAWGNTAHELLKEIRKKTDKTTIKEILLEHTVEKVL